MLSTKSALSSGNRYHEGRLLTVPSLPSPDSSKTYLFEHVIGMSNFVFAPDGQCSGSEQHWSLQVVFKSKNGTM